MADRRDFDALKTGTDSAQDVVKVWPNDADLDPDKTKGRRLLGLFWDIIDTFRGYLDRLSSNNIRGLDPHVTNLTTRDALSARYLVLGVHCSVAENRTAAEIAAGGTAKGPAEYALIADSAGPVLCYIDADPLTTQQTTARWVLYTGSAEQRTGSYPPFVQLNHPYRSGDIFRYTFPGPKIRLFQVTDNYQPSNINPVPTGLDSDLNYLPFAPLDSGSTHTDLQPGLPALLPVLGVGRQSFTVPEGMDIGNVWWVAWMGSNLYQTVRILPENWSYAGTQLTIFEQVHMQAGDFIDVTFNKQ